MLVRNVLCFFLLFFGAISYAEPVYDLLNPNAQQALSRAQIKAREMGAPRVLQIHMFWALLQDEEQRDVALLLKQIGGEFDLKLLKASVDQILTEQTKTTNTSNLPPLGDDLAKFLRNSCREAHTELREAKIDSESVLISMITHGDSDIREAAKTAHLEKNDALTTALARRGVHTGDDKRSYQKTALDEFGVDLTETARRKRFRPAVGMAHEIKEVKKKFLGRRGKGIALVGRSGVGKSKVIEEIARLTALPVDEQPEQFRNRRVVVIDVASITAGASHHGEAEGRIKAILEAAKVPVNGVETLLVLDNIKPPERDKASTADFGTALAREMEHLPGVILTCEEDVWHNYILGKTALGNKIQDVRMLEPDAAATFEILKDHRPALERMYGVKIEDGALHTAQELAKRFYGETPEPRRTLELLESVCESHRYELNDLEPPTREVDEKIRLVEYEISRWSSKTNSTMAGPKLEKLRAELDALLDEKKRLEAKFTDAVTLKKRYDEVSTYVKQLEAYLKFAKTERVTPPINTQEVEGLLQARREEIAQIERQLQPLRTDYPILRNTLDGSHVASVVSYQKKVPVGHMTGGIQERLQELEKFLDENLIGQEEAKIAIRKAVYKYFTEIRDPNKPFVIRFKGLSGVGKTEMAKLLNEFLFGSKDLFTLNMTEYIERHTVSQLYGSPVGYEGHYEGGKLTNHVMKNPFSVVLIDEADKAHKDVLTAFMRPFDEGKGADSVGRRVDYSNIIFIQTDNEMDDTKWRPEYLNRIQETVEFKQLTEAELLKVFELKIKPVYDRIFDKLGITVKVPDEIRMEMCREAASTFGARQIANVIDRYVVGPVAENYVYRLFREGDEVTILKADDGSSDFVARVTGNNGCGGALDAASGGAGGATAN